MVSGDGLLVWRSLGVGCCGGCSTLKHKYRGNPSWKKLRFTFAFPYTVLSSPCSKNGKWQCSELCPWATISESKDYLMGLDVILCGSKKLPTSTSRNANCECFIRAMSKVSWDQLYFGSTHCNRAELSFKQGEQSERTSLRTPSCKKY